MPLSFQHLFSNSKFYPESQRATNACNNDQQQANGDFNIQSNFSETCRSSTNPGPGNLYGFDFYHNVPETNTPSNNKGNEAPKTQSNSGASGFENDLKLYSSDESIGDIAEAVNSNIYRNAKSPRSEASSSNGYRLFNEQSKKTAKNAIKKLISFQDLSKEFPVKMSMTTSKSFPSGQATETTNFPPGAALIRRFSAQVLKTTRKGKQKTTRCRDSDEDQACGTPNGFESSEDPFSDEDILTNSHKVNSATMTKLQRGSSFNDQDIFIKDRSSSNIETRGISKSSGNSPQLEPKHSMNTIKASKDMRQFNSTQSLRSRQPAARSKMKKTSSTDSTFGSMIGSPKRSSLRPRNSGRRSRSDSGHSVTFELPEIIDNFGLGRDKTMSKTECLSKMLKEKNNEAMKYTEGSNSVHSSLSNSTDDMQTANNLCHVNSQSKLNKDKNYENNFAQSGMLRNHYSESLSSEESSLIGNPWVEETDLLLSTLISGGDLGDGKSFLSHEYLSSHLASRISPRQYDTGISSGQSTGEAASTPTSHSPQCLPTAWTRSKSPSPIPPSRLQSNQCYTTPVKDQLPPSLTSPVTIGCGPIPSPLLPLSLGWSSNNSSGRESVAEERRLDSGYWDKSRSTVKLVQNSKDKPQGVRVVTQGRQFYLPYAFLQDGRLRLHIVRGEYCLI